MSSVIKKFDSREYLYELEYSITRRSDLREQTTEDKFSLITSRSAQIGPNNILKPLLYEQLASSLHDKTPLRVKYGIDPTGSDVHIGHAVPLLVVDRLRRMGCHIDFIIGDFTALIGDPTGREHTREALTHGQISSNLQTYVKQVAPIIDLNGKDVTIHYNSTWLNSISMLELLKLASQLNIHSLLDRRDFQNRLQAQIPVYMHEVMYAFAMGLDSVQLKTDIEVGGVDQLLNMMLCRAIMTKSGLKSENIVTTPLIPGTDGTHHKMSKSRKNYIALTEPPESIFTKIMELPLQIKIQPTEEVEQIVFPTLGEPYGLLQLYLLSFTDITESQLNQFRTNLDMGNVTSIQAKQLLGKSLVRLLHGDDGLQRLTRRYVRYI